MTLQGASASRIPAQQHDGLDWIQSTKQIGKFEIYKLKVSLISLAASSGSKSELSIGTLLYSFKVPLNQSFFEFH